jgi:hypothetical protein
MNRRALVAIINARLRAERRTIVYACVAATIVAFIAPHGIARFTNPLDADLAIRSVWLAGPMFFCSIIGIVVALFQGPGRHRALDVSEESAPLFGRELARAKALVPCIVSVVAALTYWCAQLLSGFAAPPTFFILALACVLASSLVALNATIRRGSSRTLYITIAIATTLIAYTLAVYADAFHVGFSRAFSRYDDIFGVAAELGFCAIIGFIALRQYGEALARYDPS